MPTYEYKCKKCGNEFEIEQRITADPLTVCPDENCKGEVYRKISKNVGLLFKGSGFYLTDYAKKHESPAAKPANANGTESKSEPTNTGTDSKNGTSTPKVDAPKKVDSASA